jgi:hypothetical protein
MAPNPVGRTDKAPLLVRLFHNLCDAMAEYVSACIFDDEKANKDIQTHGQSG